MAALIQVAFRFACEGPTRAASYNQRTAPKVKDLPARNEIVTAVIDSIGAVSPDVGTVNATTQLLGPEAVLDSVGFVTLLIALERNLGNAVDLSAAFLEQDGVDEALHPFSTVGSLADHIMGLLANR
jgi:acyl carrier protein